MSLSAQEITQQLLILPEREQQEALDFIEFLHLKLARGKLQTTESIASSQENQTKGAQMLNLMDEFGLLGCMEGDGTLSENYKQHLWNSR